MRLNIKIPTEAHLIARLMDSIKVSNLPIEEKTYWIKRCENKLYTSADKARQLIENCKPDIDDIGED